MDCNEVEIWSSSSHHPSSSSSSHHPHLHHHSLHHHHHQHPHLEGRGWLVIRWGVGRRLPLNCHPQAPGQPNPELENIQPPKYPISKSMLNQLTKSPSPPPPGPRPTQPRGGKYPAPQISNILKYIKPINKTPRTPANQTQNWKISENTRLPEYPYPEVYDAD